MNKELIKQETQRFMQQGGKSVDTVTSTGGIIEKGTPTGLPYSFAKQLARKKVKEDLGYKIGKLGKSEFATLLSRKERKQAAKQHGETFEPQYNGKVYKLTLGDVEDKKGRKRFGVVSKEEVVL